MTRWIVGFTCLFSAQVVYAQARGVPDALIEVAARQVENGKPSLGIHVFELFCYGGRCVLTTTSLNQCRDIGNGKRAFYPKVQRSSTEEGNLAVRSESGRLVAEEKGDALGEYTITLRFDFVPPQGRGAITRVTGFSGALVKDSGLTDQILSLTYAALPEEYQAVALDCPVFLPGVLKRQ